MDFEDEYEEGTAASDGTAELATAQGLLQDFLRALDLPGTVNAQIKDDQILLQVESLEGGTLIGRKGQTLNALQHLINASVRSAKFRVFVDIGDYRQRSNERLEEIAHRVAQQAKETRRRVELKPMTAAERRVIHMTIATYDDLSTESVGEEPYRRIVVIPAGAPPLGVDHRRSMQGERGADRGGFNRDRGPRPQGGQRVPRRDRPDDRPGYPAPPAARQGGTGGDRVPRQDRPNVDRWGYTRDIPAEARAWMDEGSRVVPLSGSGNTWEDFESAEVAPSQPQPWVKDQPTFRPAGNPWADKDDVDYREPGSNDRW